MHIDRCCLCPLLEADALILSAPRHLHFPSPSLPSPATCRGSTILRVKIPLSLRNSPPSILGHTSASKHGSRLDPSLMVLRLRQEQGQEQEQEQEQEQLLLVGIVAGPSQALRWT